MGRTGYHPAQGPSVDHYPETTTQINQIRNMHRHIRLDDRSIGKRFLDWLNKDNQLVSHPILVTNFTRIAVITSALVTALAFWLVLG